MGSLVRIPGSQLAITCSLVLAIGCSSDGKELRRLPLPDASSTTDADGPRGDAGETDAGETDAGDVDASTCVIETCNGIDDDCDDLVDEELVVDCRFDVDGDGRSLSPDVLSLCAIAGACPSGYVRADQDRGADCDDSNPAVWESVALRDDLDGDGYCGALPASIACVDPDALPAGRRRSVDCQSAVDCRDANPHANVTCVLPDHWTTTPRTLSCEIGSPQTESVWSSAVAVCPLGFHPGDASVANSNPPIATCSVTNVSSTGATVTKTCSFASFGSTTCTVHRTCSAD